MQSAQEIYYSRRNLEFMLFEVLDLLSLTRHPYFSGHNKESVLMVLDTAAQIADKILRPVLVETDRNPPVLQNGAVHVHPSVAIYYKAFCESGLMAACFDEAHGGQQLPKSVYAAADFILGNAHNGIEMFSSLANGAARLLVSFGSEQLVREYVPRILNGTYAATMCLTETGAGSSLGDIITEAVPTGDGEYHIHGQKIFISAGDHDATDNIIHLVLARIKGAAKGAKGISLFVVPKKLPVNGDLVGNDVASIGIYHKMGQKSTPAMHLEFGGKGNCRGWLVGEEGKGLFYMFQMMNTARLGVGLAGSFIASAAYYASLRYATQRPQGRRAFNRNPEEPQVSIIHHPDIRRMLFLQKSIVEGTLALVLQCYRWIDLEKISNPGEGQRYEDLLGLLTPVAKTAGAEWGLVSVSNGLQVLGGYGYTEDFILEQLLRDVRIMSIYEGTTGIQSQTLLGRQVSMHEGRALNEWLEEINKDIGRAERAAGTKPYADWLSAEARAFERLTRNFLLPRKEKDPEAFLGDANLYMELFGLINMGWQWLKQATVAEEKLASGNAHSQDVKFYQSKIETMQFYFHYELVKTKGLHARLQDDKILTVWKPDDPLL